MISKVRLKNWRSHLLTELDFSEGTNCFIGSMGAGKTSILDAICFALFGTFPTLASKKLRLEDVIMKKPKQQQAAEVVVTFEIDDDVWAVKRTIGKGKTSAELRKNGLLVESPQSTKVTEEIEKLLKTGYDLFTRAIYSEQNQLDMFLTIPKGQRMRRIDELLAIDRFEKARQTVLALINRTRSSVAEKQQLLASMAADETLKGLADLKTEFASMNADRAKLEQHIKTAAGNRSRAQSRIENLRTAQQQVQVVGEKLATEIALQAATQEDINRLSGELTAGLEMSDADLAQQLAAVVKRIAAIREGAEAERARLIELKELSASKTAKIRMLEDERIPELAKGLEEAEKIRAQLRRKSVKKLTEQLDDVAKELERRGAALQRAEARIAELEEGLAELRATADVCPVCDAALSEKKKAQLMEKKERMIVKLKNDLVKIPQQLEQLKAETKDLETAVREARRLEDRLSDLAGAEAGLKLARTSIRQLADEITGYSKELRMLEKTAGIAERALDAERATEQRFRGLLDRRQELNEKLARLKQREAMIAQLKTEQGRLPPVSLADLKDAEAEFGSAIAAESQLTARLENISALIAERNSRIRQLDARKDELERHQTAINRVQAIAEQLGLLESALVATQEQLRKNFVTAVNQAMQSLWTALYPYRDFFSIRLGVEEGDYVLQLQDSTGWIAADGVASGGERSIACLALRMAFALVLAPQLRWLVLDEPTHNLDARAVDDLAAVLRDKIGEFVEQVFLITHDPALEAAVTGYLYRLERDKEKDGMTQLIRMAGPES